MNLNVNYNRNLKHNLKYKLANMDYNRFYNLTWKNREDELEDYFKKFLKAFSLIPHGNVPCRSINWSLLEKTACTWCVSLLFFVCCCFDSCWYQIHTLWSVIHIRCPVFPSCERAMLQLILGKLLSQLTSTVTIEQETFLKEKVGTWRDKNVINFKNLHFDDDWQVHLQCSW